jgi:quercetin dioxygenase-like cupin family protein
MSYRIVETTAFEGRRKQIAGTLRGAGVLRVDGDEVQLHPGRYVLVEPESTRQVVAGPDGLSYAVVGAVV